MSRSAEPPMIPPPPQVLILLSNTEVTKHVTQVCYTFKVLSTQFMFSLWTSPGLNGKTRLWVKDFLQQVPPIASVRVNKGSLPVPILQFFLTLFKTPLTPASRVAKTCRPCRPVGAIFSGRC